MFKSQIPAAFSVADGDGGDLHTQWYESSLKSVSTSAELLYTYTHAIHGFSTRLTAREAQLLQSQPGILSVTQETVYHLHTTRSPAFLGLDLASDLLPHANTVGEVVVGVLDTGAWPESKSYNDAGKLIGARFFARGVDEIKESRSPRDDDGHGTHTSTTTAGSAVDGASLFGFAAGTARGMATRARVAVYKVCWMGGCFSSDILAAMDAAIQDGVNVLSMSLGGGTSDYYRDSVAIGAFSAMEKGILVSCSAGTLIPEQVKGKIVLCDRGMNARAQKGAVVKDAGGLGMVLANTAANGEELVADAHLLPTTAVGQKNGDEIKRYLLSDRNPTVIAPGVNILAGWTGKLGPTGLAADPRRVEFNIISGTSMSCPHVAGLAALVKAAHPEWSPAAVKSALMTTAYVTYKDGNASTPFDHGAGHVDPVSALNPGLIYDLTADDYLSFLCALNYTDLQINNVARRNYTCDPKKTHSVSDFNYPSFAVNVDTTQINGGGKVVMKHTRTVTNVGESGVYKVAVTPNQIPGVKIVVEPETLSFKQANEKKGYTVTFTASSMPIGTNSFARLEWSDGKHVAGSAIAVSWS
ncbi:Subtilisin-like protease SBT1.7 [Linum perenne]